MKSKHLLLLMLLALFAPWAANAQPLSTYSVTVGTETYTSIADNGGTLLSSVTGDGGSQTVALPFDFPFGETTFTSGTTLTVRADGYLYFGSSNPGHQSKNAWTSTSSYRIISPFFNSDGRIDRSDGPDGAAYYAVVNDASNNPEMLVIEFVHLECYYSPYGDYNFQVRLHKNGNISAVYETSTLSTYSSASQNFFLFNGSSDKICLEGSYASPTAGTPSSLPNFTTAPAAGEVITYVRPVITCPKPTLTDVTPSTDHASLQWTENGSATQWRVEYSTSSDFSANVQSENFEDTPSGTITGLNSGTTYYARVIAMCEPVVDESFPSNVLSFNTECAILTVTEEHPFQQNFDGVSGTTSGTTNNLPLCWNYINECSNSTYQGYPVVYSGSSYAHSGNNYLRFYSYYYSSSSDPQDQYAILPEMQGVNSLRMKLYARAYSTSSSYSTYDATFHVGVMTNPEDETTFTEVATYTPTTTTYELYTIPFSSYTGTGHYIAIMIDAAETGGSTFYRTVCIDDIVVEPIPSCLEPDAPEYVAGSADTESAKVTWTPNGNETSWDLYWSTSATAPTASTTPTAESVTMTNNEYTITGLNASTKYYVWVRAHCSATDQSLWSGPCSFTTACAARTITDAEPYSENFNGYTGCSTSAGPLSTYPEDELPLCWSFLNRSETSSTYPQVFLTSYSSYAVSGNCLFFRSSIDNPLYAILPEFTNDISTLQLTFTYRNEGTGTINGTLYVGYMTDPTDASTFQVKYTCTQTTTLTTPDPVYFADAPAGSYIAFRYTGGTSDNYYLSIDDVEVALAPTCWQPQNLAASDVTNESAVLTWERHAMGTETSWVLQYGTDETFATYIDEVTVNTDPTYTIQSGLSATTTYYVRVKPACDNEGLLWSEVLEFDTEADCAAPTVAVTEGSETATGATITWNGRNDSYAVEYREVITAPVEFDETYGFEGNSWQGWTPIDNDGDNNSWMIASEPHTGSSCVRSYYTPSGSGYNANNWLISPQIPLGGTISFYAKQYSNNGDERFQVFVSTTGTNISDFTAISEVINPSATYQQYTYSLSDYSGQGYIAIVHTSTTAYAWYMYVDDINITASIDGEYGAWQQVNEANPTSPYTFSTLNDNSTYEVRVKGFCGSNESDYSEVVSFTTLEACPAPTEFALGTVTTETAAISWNGGIATEWKVWIKESTETEYPSTFSTVSTASKTFEDLADNTTFDVKIAPTCDETKYLEVEDAFTTLDACPAPTGFTLGEVTAHEASFTWTQPDNGVAINEWTVKYKKSSETEYTNAPNVTGTPSATLENLNASTTYQVVIAPACNAEKTLEGSFTTACDAITDLPWSEDFEGFDNNTVPMCWDNSGSGTSTVSGTSSYYVWGVYKNSNNNMIRMNNYWVQDGTALINTPTIVLPAEGAYQLSFDYSHTATCGDFTIKISQNGGTSFTDLRSFSKTSTGTSYTDPGEFTHATISLANYAGKSIILQFFANANYGSGAIFVDNIKIQQFFTKEITGYDNGSGNWYLIASPLADDVDPTTVGMITDELGETATSETSTYDLYRFDQTQSDEWLNYRKTSFNLANGTGYLYANKNDVTLTFAGLPYDGNSKVVTLSNDPGENTTTHLAGYNLVGNPFTVNAYIGDRDFYVMNNGTEIILADRVAEGAAEYIEPMEGIFVITTEETEQLTFTTTAPESKGASLALNVNKNRGVVDRAMVRFSESRTLPKFQLRNNSTKVYIPQDNIDYAVVSAEAMGELPVSQLPRQRERQLHAELHQRGSLLQLPPPRRQHDRQRRRPAPDPELHLRRPHDRLREPLQAGVRHGQCRRRQLRLL